MDQKTKNRKEKVKWREEETVYSMKLRLGIPSKDNTAHREVFLGCGEMKDVTI